MGTDSIYKYSVYSHRFTGLHTCDGYSTGVTILKLYSISYKLHPQGFMVPASTSVLSLLSPLVWFGLVWCLSCCFPNCTLTCSMHTTGTYSHTITLCLEIWPCQGVIAWQVTIKVWQKGWSQWTEMTLSLTGILLFYCCAPSFCSVLVYCLTSFHTISVLLWIGKWPSL